MERVERAAGRRGKWRALLAVVVLALAGACGDGVLAPLISDDDRPETPPAPPALTLCRRVLADTVWIDGIPHVEYLNVCTGP